VLMWSRANGSRWRHQSIPFLIGDGIPMVGVELKGKDSGDALGVI